MQVARIGFLVLTLAVHAGCLSLLRVQESHRGDWQRVGVNQFRYVDSDWEILFNVTAERTFTWRIRNNSRVTLRIPQSSITLRRENDAQAYSMWGEPRTASPLDQELMMKPGRFVSLAFPVRYSSEWFPFRVAADRPAWVDVDVFWGRQAASYRLFFPPSPN